MAMDSLPRERLTWSAPENAYLFDDEGMPEVSGLRGTGENYFQEEESDIHADPLGLCCESRGLCGVEREPRRSYAEVVKCDNASQQREALAWARKTRDELARREAEILNAKLGPNLFKFGEVPSVSLTEPGFWCVNEYVNSDRPSEPDTEAQDFPGQAK